MRSIDVTDAVDENECLPCCLGETLWLQYGPYVIERNELGRAILRFKPAFEIDEP